MNYFSCSTNEGSDGKDGRPLEDWMREKNVAAIWEWRPEDGKKVCFRKHMEEVEEGDFIFMFRRGVACRSAYQTGLFNKGVAE
jgi:hypothetical protein